MTWLSAVLVQLAEHWPEAVITFAATFAGVLASFWVERRRSAKQERDDFGKVLLSLVQEIASNSARLAVIKDCSVSKIPGFSLSNRLALTLGTPLFHRWATRSLVTAATMLSTHTELVNNSLARLRAASPQQIFEHTIEELKGAAKKGQELIDVMTGLISDELPKFGGHPKADAKTNETNEKLRSIMEK